MILVGCLVPLALYLLLLGWINRRPRPIWVSGTLDLIGLLFGLSGFLLLVGPAVLSSLNERWRMYYLFGEGNPLDALEGFRQLWLFLALIYFGLVVGTCVWLFLQRRSCSCVYNIDPENLDSAVEEVCEEVGIEFVRTGSTYSFRMAGREEEPGAETPVDSNPPAQGSAENIAGVKVAHSSTVDHAWRQLAVCHFEVVQIFKHVTLRWDQADSPVRELLESELEKQLQHTDSPEHETGVWLHLIGCGLLVLSSLTILVLIIRNILNP